jgi:hypothetical protein
VDYEFMPNGKVTTRGSKDTTLWRIKENGRVLTLTGKHNESPQDANYDIVHAEKNKFAIHLFVKEKDVFYYFERTAFLR